jgi:hypothetical protein
MKSLILFLVLIFSIETQAQSVNAKLISVKKIWDQSPHNAFTDLIRFKGKFYCVFREGTKHAEGEGKLRVLVSKDGEQWKSAAIITESGRDLRDAKISITPDNRLMLNGGSADPFDHSVNGSFHSIVTFSKDGSNWSPAQQVNFNPILIRLRQIGECTPLQSKAKMESTSNASLKILTMEQKPRFHSMKII